MMRPLITAGSFPAMGADWSQVERRLAGVREGDASVPGYVYVIGKLDGTMTKVGISKCPLKRFNDLQHATGDALGLFYLAPAAHPRRLEKAVHHYLSERRARREWFAVRPEVAINAVKAMIAEPGGAGPEFKTITVKGMDKRSWEWVKAHAAQRGESIATVVARAIELRLATEAQGGRPKEEPPAG
jgi:hypothetical protein